jgi:anti-sigma factor RsiW
MTADDLRAGPPAGHADLDTLADLHAGGLDEAEAARVRGHVDGCTQCSATLAALDSVQAQLRSLPAPPVPAAVAGRLDATLADLRTERSAPAARPARPAAPALDPEDELELARARRVHRLTRAISAVAAAVVVIAAGGAVAAIVRTATSSNDSATSGGAASAPVAPQSERESPGATGLDSAAGRGQAAVPAYDRSSLRAALPAIAAQGTSPVPATMADPARRAACAGSIPTAAGSLRGVQRILYRDQPAYVFVYDDGGRLTGYVVTEACGTAPGLPATVVDTVS